MGDVVDFTQRRLARDQHPPTFVELAERAEGALSADWAKMQGSLNEYFKASLPTLVDQASTVNYMVSLTDVAVVERNLAHYPTVLGPGSQPRQHGWRVQVRVQAPGSKEPLVVVTPELPSEEQARCFAVLLLLRLRRETLG